MWKKQGQLNVRRKNRKKAIRTVLQLAVLIWIGWLIFQAVNHVRTYEEPERAAWTNQDGFIALSYFGVGRTGTAKLVDNDLMEEHLLTLQEQGYVTISQQDIRNYYEQGSPLPDKALFLAFEDGRNDSALYAQSILEKLDYRATMMTYAEKMQNHERKFLRPKDLRKMLKSGYWELGTNGYRLSYINIFDYEGQFLGVLSDSEMKKQQDIEKIAYYNHYLMDFIRDDRMVPVENREEMFERIDRDYALLEQDYAKAFGDVPDVYMIMHANTVYGGMNRLVEEANVRNIERLFPVHFNREGTAYNTGTDSPHNLTRLQVAPYWYTNHLLMKIQKDTGEPVIFVTGDEKRARQWATVSGAAQFIHERIVLTSPPGETGRLVLQDSEAAGNIRLTADLAGNVVGHQAIQIRYDQEQDTYLRVGILDNRLRVEQKAPGQAQAHLLLEQELGEVHWKSEDLAFDKASVYTREQTAAGAAIAYEDGQIPINIQQKRQLDVLLLGDRLTIAIDGETWVEGLEIDAGLQGSGIALEARYSEQNRKDDIYDAVFDRLAVASVHDQGEVAEELYSNKLTGISKVRRAIANQVNALVDWSIEAF
ncbi:polysaccharide deacetylase [Xylanibacillus composti]|uniref:NodB homology domain-containing protein n=1 Tax=Xylanibacillus composti TaxID=1572762 RepID=A0A8J4M3S1_9BACL|nr:polysaccharide deacetylase family protein [Xylanibacillus composti]MDT9726886.1 polysaccharide deacetylase [Xylanibacillus composti]GIQ69801.1 hypothetical protein XYCOK13_26250 [Xylanibacillus composti]